MDAVYFCVTGVIAMADENEVKQVQEPTQEQQQQQQQSSEQQQQQSSEQKPAEPPPPEPQVAETQAPEGVPSENPNP
jgi:hemolysin activation/secretion protein